MCLLYPRICLLSSVLQDYPKLIFNFEQQIQMNQQTSAEHKNQEIIQDTPKTNGQLINNKTQQEIKPLLTIIHFNDVYDIQPKGGSMGVCHFKAKMDQLRKENPDAITLFSGDCMSPSTLTNIKEGWQMVHALNTLKIDCACFGNHQFDFEIDHTLKLIKATNFPWLLGNIRFISTGHELGGGKPWMTMQKNGLKIGILGVAGQDWIGILSDQYEDKIEYQDCYQFAKRTAKHLRQVQKCDLVIALTHMRNTADKQFPKKVQNCDLVLGGHDHVILEQLINGTAVIKSGTNFNNIGLIKLYPKQKITAKLGNRVNYQWQIFKITIAQKIDEQLKAFVDGLMEQYSKFDQVIGFTDVPLQTSFVKIRTSQSNYGNFLTDLSRLYYDSNIAVINSGMVRNDTIIPKGRLTYSKISNIIDSQMIVKKVNGKAILDMLEYSVSQYPGFAGQFLFVSGLSFQFNPNTKPRVKKVIIGDQQLDLQRFYTLTTTAYQGRGGDGFEMLRSGEMIVDEVKATSMLNLLLKFFKASDSHQQFESIKILKEEGIKPEDNDLPTFPIEHLVLVKKPSVRIGRIKDVRSRFVLNQEGKKLTSIAPALQGRIVCLEEYKE